MKFLLWLSVPYLVLGVLHLKKEASHLGDSLFAKQRWDLLHCVEFFSLMILSLIVIKGISKDWPILQGNVLYGLGDLCAMILLVLYFRYRLGQPFYSLGLDTQCLRQNILYGLEWILPWTMISTTLGLVMTTFLDQPLMEAKGNEFSPPVGPLHAENRSIGFFIELICSVVLGPLREELVHRGFFYGPIRRRVSRRTAIFISSALFAYFHASSERKFPFMPFLLGCLFAYLIEQRQSLIPSIVAHSFWNLISSLRTSYRHNYFDFLPTGHFAEFLGILLGLQVILFLTVLRLQRRTEKQPVSLAPI